MFPTQKNAKTKEVQDSAGYNTIQWNRFYYLTKKEAKKLVQEDCDFRWPSIPANEKIALFERVKAQLAAEGIPEVRDDILEWRMAHTVRDTRQNAIRKAAMPTT